MSCSCKTILTGLAVALGTLVVTSANASVTQQETVKLVPSDAGTGGGAGFGGAVTTSGDYIIVGAPDDSTLAQRSGAAYVFKRDDSGTPKDPTDDTWVEEAKLIGSDAGFMDFFGYSVSIDGHLAVIGAPHMDPAGSDFGWAYVFRREAQGWVEEQKLVSSGSIEDDGFGSSVSISGELIVVGAPFEPMIGGHGAYVFRREGSTWVEEAALIGSDTGPEDLFGGSVAISGELVVVGASGHDDAGSNSGSAYVFRRDGTTWVQEAQLIASDATDWAFFGESASIRNDSVVVGAFRARGVERRAGAVYVFRRNAGLWAEEAKLTASDGHGLDDFGSSVAIHDNWVVVGAPAHDDAGDWSGSAYLFSCYGTKWFDAAKLVASDASTLSRVGVSVSVSRDLALVGSFNQAAYIYHLSDIPPVIPAVSTWGMLLLAVLILVAATMVLARRHHLYARRGVLRRWDFMPRNAGDLLRKRRGIVRWHRHLRPGWLLLG